MKKSQLQSIIKEELTKVLNEDVNATVASEVQKAFTKLKMPILSIHANVQSATMSPNVLIKFRDMFVEKPDELINLYNKSSKKIMFSDVEQIKTDTYRFYIDKTSGMFARMEAKVNIPDQGYGSAYYHITSDILEKWDDISVITKDIKGFLEAAHEAGGPKLVKEVINAMLAQIKKSQSLLRMTRGSNEPYDTDLA